VASPADVRVLLIDPSDRGGIRAYTGLVADGLRAAGAEPAVLTTSGEDDFGNTAYPVLRMLPTQSWGRPADAGPRWAAGRAMSWLAAARTVRSVVRHRQPDVVHFQAGLNRRFDARLLRRLRKQAKVVWTAHDVLPFERTPADERRFAEIYRAADVVIVHNEPAAAAVRELAGVEAVVVAHPLPPRDGGAQKQEARQQLGLRPDGRLLVAAGFIRPYKGYDLLADVWERLGDDAPRLLVVGEALSDEGRSILERLERSPRVVVRSGYVPDDEFRLAIGAADAVLLPYEEASDSGVLHLARVSGVPVLASDVEQLAAVIERTRAGRVLPRTTDAWAEAVRGDLPDPPPTPDRPPSAVGEDHLAAYGGAASRSRLRLMTYTDATTIGGAELALATLVRSFDPDVEVTVAGVDAAVVEWIAAQRPGAQTTLLRPVRGKFDVLRISAHVRRMRALRPDVLHAQLRHPWSCQYGILAGLLTPGVKVVVVEAATLGTDSAVQRLVKRWASRHVDAHVAVGERSARIIERAAGLPPNSVRTIYLGVEDRELPARGGAGGAFRVGCLSRLSPEKCLDDLIRAMQWLPGTELILVGDGPERSTLEQLARALRLDGSVTFTGWRDDARATLAKMDVVALPSRSESLPLVIVEAMLAELPVVATDVGSVAEAVKDGITGVIVPVGSPRALATAVQSLRDDPQLRRRMGAEARRIALSRFSPASTARAFRALYDEVRS
jgi:glycosyltransferase involved in cell wall biosynthesis